MLYCTALIANEYRERQWLEGYKEGTGLENKGSIRKSFIIILDREKTQASFWIKELDLKLVNNSQNE